MSTASVGCAILGSGNIGTDLMIKVLRSRGPLSLRALAGIDPASEGLARAERLGVATTHGGLEGLLADAALFASIDIVFDATSAAAHHAHARILAAHGKTAIDLTPAAVGPPIVPAVNLGAHLDAQNVNLITCGGQATIPIVYAISRTAPVTYAEMISSIASKSAGPGTRQNIDEFTQTTARALESVGGAARGKAIIILNPAEPPRIMRNTVYAVVPDGDESAIRSSLADMEAALRAYVPGYRFVAPPLFEDLEQAPVVLPGGETLRGLKVSVLLEVEGAAHYLPAYAGNLDIMTAAALRTGELFAGAGRGAEGAQP